MGEPGLPLTTGEGNTAEHRVREMLVALRLELPSAVWDDVYERTNALSVECGRLREQLDAARQALTSYRHDHDYRSPIAYERCLCRLCVAARAVLESNDAE